MSFEPSATTPTDSPSAARGPLPDQETVLAVRGAFANLRREPSHAAELVSQLVLGERARVVTARGDWLEVVGPDDYPGWVHHASLAAPASGTRQVVWTWRGGVLREGPAPDSAPLCDLTLGGRAKGRAGEGVTSVLLPGRTVGWSEGAGWVDAERIGDRFPREGGALVHTALSLRGVPYLWGGTSSKAFDCSGFVQRVFGLHGVSLPRDAWQQAEVGKAIEPGNGGEALRPGDLLFFAEGGNRVTHVAIALGERGRFVHSSTARAGVGVDGLDPADPVHRIGLARTLTVCRRVV